MTSEKNADISLACLGGCFGMSLDSLSECSTLELWIRNFLINVNLIQDVKINIQINHKHVLIPQSFKDRNKLI